jgi:hypothetical protein
VGEDEADSVWAWAIHARQISRADAPRRQEERKVITLAPVAGTGISPLPCLWNGSLKQTLTAGLPS